MAVLVKVYGDTNTLPDHTRDPDKLAALEWLRLDRRVAWFTSASCIVRQRKAR